MSMFKVLSITERHEYKKWARENYKPFEDIKGIWHPIVQEECIQINREVSGYQQTRQLSAYQAIHIKWYGPTDRKPSRYRVMAAAGPLWVPKNFNLSVEDNVRCVAEQYCKDKGWPYRDIFIGQLYDGNWVAVLLSE